MRLKPTRNALILGLLATLLGGTTLFVYRWPTQIGCALIVSVELLGFGYGIVRVASRGDSTGWWSGAIMGVVGYFLLFTGYVVAGPRFSNATVPACLSGHLDQAVGGIAESASHGKTISNMDFVEMHAHRQRDSLFDFTCALVMGGIGGGVAKYHRRHSVPTAKPIEHEERRV